MFMPASSSRLIELSLLMGGPTLAQVGINTVKRVEQSTEMTGSVRTLWKIQTALETAGIEFISAEGGKGPGVRLKEPARPAQKLDRKGR
jgi:hypothetical protein